MAAAAVTKNRKSPSLSQQRFDWSPQNLARWCILARWHDIGTI